MVVPTVLASAARRIRPFWSVLPSTWVEADVGCGSSVISRSPAGSRRCDSEHFSYPPASKEKPEELSVRRPSVIVMSQARTYPAGVPSWIDVEVGDVGAAQAFYGGLFGWTFWQASPASAPDRYVIAHLDDLEVAGLTGPAEPTPTPDRPRWHTYVAVDDIHATCALVEPAGGRITEPPAQVGEAGHWANLLDPSGAELSLWQAGSRLGVQLANVPGAWNFSDLHVPDPAAVRGFYEHVFGWVFADLGFATMIQVPGYGDHLASTSDPDIHARQASAPPGFADVIGGVTTAGPLGPHWHVTFTVADRDATAALAESLGATVLAREDTDWTRQVTVRDPQGAVSTASQSTPPA